MYEDTRPVTFEAPKELAEQIVACQVESSLATAAGPELEIIGRYILASWIGDLKEDSPQHVAWISLFGKALLAYPGSLIRESYRWPFEMLAEMAD